jgi:phenylalanyl-tRNA synthetase alpha chain
MKNSLLQSLAQLEKDFLHSLPHAQTESSLLEFKTSYLGKKGKLTDILKQMGQLSSTERPEVGSRANQVKKLLEREIQEAVQKVKKVALDQQLSREVFDYTLPGRPQPIGHLHPITQIIQQTKDFFERLGFESKGFESGTGHEIEDDYHNFEALNIPANHPARDLQDTFYLQQTGWLLRTHTSNIQIRVMEQQPPPVRITAIGAVYRCDSDVTHTPMFHQIEGLWIDEQVTFADLKGVLSLFVQNMFGKSTQVRFRPSFFPFTEPSAELDMSCIFCAGKGCTICKRSGWIEILGCGMVDPAVFQSVRYDPDKYTGFAFGIGIERLAMLKFGINDIRLFFENDFRFLKQF